MEFVADGTLGSLEHLPSSIIGFAGGQGSSNNMLGANAKPRIVKVPAGTMVYNTDKEVSMTKVPRAVTRRQPGVCGEVRIADNLGHAC